MYFITVSEMLGTQGQAVANKVAEKLNYAYFGEDELLKAAGEMGFLSEVQKLDEKGPPLLEKFFTEKPRIYLDRLQAVIYEVAKKGDAVFFGRGSQLLLHSFDCAFHVLVTGSLEKRVERITEEKHVGKEVAEKMVHQSDRDKRGFFRFAFDEDWLNPQIYDLLLNTDKLGVDSAVKMIIDAAKSEEIKACGIDS
ncbi:MAG TPA: cytidylate kinase-like family protein, partial [bacterium]|nr:cytidylate kinase-like family protein [bacterium]